MRQDIIFVWKIAQLIEKLTGNIEVVQLSMQQRKPLFYQEEDRELNNSLKKANFDILANLVTQLAQWEEWVGRRICRTTEWEQEEEEWGVRMQKGQ